MTDTIIKIAHRGNWKGRVLSRENSHNYIREAVELGYHVEVDVWFVSGSLYLGHDKPQYPIEVSFLENPKFFCHAKNIEALHFMLENPKVHCFWHQNDEVALTSNGFIWKYPEVYFDGKLWGICSDWLL